MDIPIKQNAINVVSNFHTAFLSLAQKPEPLYISIRPPNLLEKRYGIKNAVWLTYIPQGYPRAYSPDRLEFELMDIIIEYVKNGGKYILLDGVEYLSEKLGKKKIYEYVRQIKKLGDALTIGVAIEGNVEEWKGLGEFVYDERLKVPEPAVKILKKYIPGKDSITISIEEGERKLSVGGYGAADRFLFEGIDSISRSLSLIHI